MTVITGKTKLLGVIGDPVEHSLSPVMHNAAIAHLGEDYIYVPFPIKAENLSTAIAGLGAIGVVGFSITIPHKQTIIPLLTEITPVAQLVGAVNTVWRTAAGWSGTNTDIDGFLAPLKRLNLDWSQVKPVILGNGGAARAVVIGCFQLGCPQIHVLGRDNHKLDHFYQSWANTPIQAALKVHHWDELGGMVSDTQLLVNTTPVGMSPHSDGSATLTNRRSPVELEVMEKLGGGVIVGERDSTSLINRRTIVYDLIYTPNPTLFLQQAQQQGAIIIDGLEMLVTQGAVALEKWLQKPVPIDIMSQALREYLKL